MRRTVLLIPLMLMLMASLAYALEEKTVLFDRVEKLQLLENCIVEGGAVRLAGNVTEGYFVTNNLLDDLSVLKNMTVLFSGPGVYIQFSGDMKKWVNSTGAVGEWDYCAVPTALNITALGASKAFYVKIRIVGNETAVYGVKLCFEPVKETVGRMIGTTVNISLLVLSFGLFIAVTIMILLVFTSGGVREDDILFLIALVVGIVIAALAFNYFLM